MIQGKTLERLIAFTDAIVAVAITLLVLPLTDFFATLTAGNLATQLQSSTFVHLLLGVLISFFTVFSFWNGHRRTLAPVTALSKSGYWANVLWLLAIVLIPAATRLIVDNTGRLGLMLYTAVLLFGSAVSVWLRHAVNHRVQAADFITSALLVVILGLAWAVPGLGSNLFFVLFAALPLHRVVKRK
ncbi:TMEM175 family protein [Lacticaseibacillus salsurivasis]|uniref:TMEM175 family protein n=1 Tax=Lacticaseibacillus salsurivasis TaxID=3081441 RepID=UPI0030C701D3